MLGLVSRRLLPVLQLTRMALVFTAIADGLCAILLLARAQARELNLPLEQIVNVKDMLAMALVSSGLYGFGMSLNDIIDRRRDQQIAAHRPLPSGRIGIGAAHVICAALAGLALLAGAYYALRVSSAGWMTFLLVIWTALLILFYDFAGKYLVTPGLLTLGLIRFFHAVIPAPQLPLLWHPLLLMNHVTIISLIAYEWEEKRPALTAMHWWAVLGGLALVDVASVALVVWRRSELGYSLGQSLWLDRGLAVPLTGVFLFAAAGILIRRHSMTPRDAGQRLMLYGLLWLILYDAAFAAGYVGPAWGLLILGLLPVAFFSVHLMRWWSAILTLSQRPDFKRAEH